MKGYSSCTSGKNISDGNVWFPTGRRLDKISGNIFS